MGGAVSSGRDHQDLIDNLKSAKYIKSEMVEKVFRAVDRADYMLPNARNMAYKDLAWKSGVLHLSAPCIYCAAMEGLQMKPGLTFLNIGSGTGYMSTMVGLILGANGINHGIELQPKIVKYANEHLQNFIKKSGAVDEFDFCEPKFIAGNAFNMHKNVTEYDRIYCGAGCPKGYEAYFKRLIKVGGILVMPLGEHLLQVKRVSEDYWTTHCLLNVSFAPLAVPKENLEKDFELLEVAPPPLQVICRTSIRQRLRDIVFSMDPALYQMPKRPVTKPRKAESMSLPLQRTRNTRDTENFNQLHDLDAESGAHEMNALLNMVLSMSHNRMAGALRYDSASDDDFSETSSSGLSSRSQSSTDLATPLSLCAQTQDADANNSSTHSSCASTEESSGHASDNIDNQNDAAPPQATNPREQRTIVSFHVLSRGTVENRHLDASGSGDSLADRDNDLIFGTRDRDLDRESNAGEDDFGGSDLDHVSFTLEDETQHHAIFNTMDRQPDNSEWPDELPVTTGRTKRRRTTEPSSGSKKARRSPDPYETRRRHISANMAARVGRLPLPAPLRLFLNLYRTNE